MKMKTPLLSLSMLAFAACPAPSIDSVDGLAGGALTSKLTVPVVATNDVATDTLDAAGEVTAGAVTAGAVTSAGAVTGSSVVVQRGNARVSFFGLIVGTTPRIPGEAGPDADEAGTTRNYAVRQSACATAFPATTDGLPAAHVCTVHEAMAHALQAPDTVPASASGGIVHTYGHYWAGPPDENGTQKIVDDVSGIVLVTVGSTSSSLRLHRRASDNGIWSLRIVDGAAVDEPLVCCQ